MDIPKLISTVIKNNILVYDADAVTTKLSLRLVHITEDCVLDTYFKNKHGTISLHKVYLDKVKYSSSVHNIRKIYVNTKFLLVRGLHDEFIKQEGCNAYYKEYIAILKFKYVELSGKVRYVSTIVGY